MGCHFFACFSSSKNKKHQHLVDGTSSIDQKHEASEAVQFSEGYFGIPFNPISVKKEKLGELLNSNSDKKKVAFDLNVKITEDFPVESTVKLLKNEEDKKNEEGIRSSVLDLDTSAAVSKSGNNRYQNIAESEDELEDLDLEINDLDDDDIGKARRNEPQLVIEETSESLFSLSIGSRKQVCEVDSDEKEVNSPMPPITSIVNVQSVLNPVENVAQWKQLKAKAITPLKHEGKENINVENTNVEQGIDIPISPEPSFQFATVSSKMCFNDKKLVVGKETAVDTSLSSWLVTTPNSKDSADSVGNSVASQKTSSPRPILAVLTMEELKQHSASTSPRKCRSRSPDENETSIVGTVGSYWSRTGQIMDIDSSSPSKGIPKTRSRNIQEERLKWSVIPFEAKLEGALDTGIAGI